ncbi:PIN domain-containing protein [Photobacterium minamisatsumaniensis]|uniref:PIN domain-containing protein n=1 Tax=Photobacterium minamisatsumaniensis TaxID=2910233 RepID=UPI003D0B5200
MVIDTNIYRKNPKLDNLHFKALEKLTKAEVLKLHIPYVVQREFQTQQREFCKKEINKSISGLNSLLRRPLSESVLEDVQTLKDNLDSNYNEILESSEAYFIDWADRAGAEFIPLCEEQALKAMEAYFCGTAPLTQVKAREDIPDSFIVQAITKLSAASKDVVVIAEDGKLRKSFESSKDIHTYSQLSEFIESEKIQDELKDIDLIKNLPDIIEALAGYEDGTSEISTEISWLAGDKVCGSSFHDPSIPDDNNEAYISSFGEVDHIELDFSDVPYYGSGNFGIPFELVIDVYAYYYIFKADYYGLENPPSVSDHNDHYFEAEEEFTVKITGMASVKIDRDLIDFKDFSSCVDTRSIQIDEVDDITMCIQGDAYD